MDNEMNNETGNEVWLAWLDGKKDEAVEFVVPLIGCDVAQAGADALGIDVCEQLNVARKID
jgi:hypothetical protein